MPITCREPLTPLTRETFGQLSYELMREVFAIRKELGRFFDEKHYQRALALRRPDIKLEVPLHVSHLTFEKTYYLDALFASGAIIEFKATDLLTNRHRSQLMHYLMLADLERGLLVNLRPELVTKEFVNNPFRQADRHDFHIVTDAWDERLPGARQFAEVFAQLLADWGSCLDLALYEEALTHLLGGEAEVIQPVRVHFDGAALGHQAMRLATRRVAFKLTAFDKADHPNKFVPHAQRLIDHTDIDALLWANVGRHEITFRSMRGKD